ncbi:MAG: amino acid ABC transporter substrate-binding protein [Selenomonadaceae bacterium]|nr:amino acid ABC transporter substrate-binding protein [Selenomonadaceae bacterium]
MKLKKMLGILSCVVLAGALVAGCSDTKKADAPKESAKAIVVGLDDNFPPMGFRDKENKIVGFDIDMAKEAAKRLGRDVEFKAIDWSSKEAELQSGRVDVLWNGLDITEKRKENMLFSDPYMENRQIIFVRKGTKDIADEKTLAGKVVGTQSGGTTEEYIDTNEALKKSFKDYKRYSDYVAAFMDLENGRLDAIVGDEIIGRNYMSKNEGKIEAIDVAVGPISNFGIGFKKDNTALRDEVQKVLNEMKADGTSTKISEEWFGKDMILK